MESESIDLMGCSDGYHHFRQNNPVAINTFFMIGKVEHLEKIDFAASTKNIELAQTQYKKAVAAFDSFLALIPKAS